MSDQTGITPELPFQQQRFASLLAQAGESPDSELLMGTVASVNAANQTAMVYLGGSTTQSGPIPYASHLPGIVAGQQVWMAKIGNSLLIVASQGYPHAFVVKQSAFNDLSNSGQKDFTTNFPATVLCSGWTVITVTGELGLSINAVNWQSMLYTNYVTFNTALGGSGNAMQTQLVPQFQITTGIGAWSPTAPMTLVFPVTAGTTPQFTVRFAWTPNGAGVWMDYIASVVTYAG